MLTILANLYGAGQDEPVCGTTPPYGNDSGEGRVGWDSSAGLRCSRCSRVLRLADAGAGGAVTLSPTSARSTSTPATPTAGRARRPRTYYASGRNFGLDFMSGSEHSDNADLPIVASEYCIDPVVVAHLRARRPGQPARLLPQVGRDARAGPRRHHPHLHRLPRLRVDLRPLRPHQRLLLAATTPTPRATAATRRWTRSTRGSRARPRSAAARTGSRPSTTPAPSRSTTPTPASTGTTSPTSRRPTSAWSGSRSSTTARTTARYYAHALDKGWHVGAIGAEDLGHRYTDDWGGPSWAKTVILAEDRSEPALKAAMLARRFYAIRRPGITPHLHGRRAADGLAHHAHRGQARRRSRATINDPTAKLELVTSGGRVVATGLGVALRQPQGRRRRPLLLRPRARRAGNPIAYSSPVWVTALPRSGPDAGEWLAGDLHVHTCFSHDAYCGPNDDNTGPDEFYTLGLNVGAALPRGARARPRLPRDHRPQRRALLGRPRLRRLRRDRHPGLRELAPRPRADARRDASSTTTATAPPTAVNAAATRSAPTAASSRSTTRPATSTQRFDACSDTGVLDWGTATTCGPTRSRSGT